MNGRLEGELKVNAAIETMLEDCPDYVIKWHRNMKASDIEATSRRNYVTKAKHFLNFISSDIANITVEMITADVVDEYMDSIKIRTLKDGTMKQTSDSYKQGIWCALNSLFSFMYNRHLIEENYMNNIKRVKNNDLASIQKKRIQLTPNDFNKILNTVKETQTSAEKKAMIKRDYCILYLFMSTGMRKTALTEINIEDINIDDRKLTVIDKGDKEHTYYITNEFAEILKEYLEYRKGMTGAGLDALFISLHGNRIAPKTIEQIVDKYSTKALGYHLSPHKLRGGFVSIMYEQTGNIEKVRRMVGHSNISTTQRYITTDNTEKEEAQTLMSSILG